MIFIHYNYLLFIVIYCRTSADKQIRHRACSLRDYAHALIKNEMDSDFEDQCQKISKRRIDRKASVSQYLPAYINTAGIRDLTTRKKSLCIVFFFFSLQKWKHLIWYPYQHKMT